jgi:hypothetical protein
MVFAVALMVSMVMHMNMTEIFTQEYYTIVKNPGKDNMEIITKEGNKFINIPLDYHHHALKVVG